MGSSLVFFSPDKYRDSRKYFYKIHTFCIAEFAEPSVSHEDDKPEYHHLHHTSHQGYLCGVQPEPTDGVVVEDEDDVGDQDQGHSAAESFPVNNIRIFLSCLKNLEKPGQRFSGFSHAVRLLTFDQHKPTLGSRQTFMEEESQQSTIFSFLVTKK